MADTHLSTFTKGIIKENPVLRLVLGTCPTLAVTTAAFNGVGMGVAATLVLLGSNVAISLLRKVIPDKVRIPAFITIIAAFVTIIQMLVKAFAPAIDKSLGIFLPLIVVNCIILARAEMFASKNSVLPSVLDALGMGIGFTAALTLMGMIRELIGTGCIFGIPITEGAIEPMLIFILPPGGFFVFGMLVVLSNKIAVKMGKKPVKSLGCGSCRGCAGCDADGRSEDNETAPAQSESKNGATGVNITTNSEVAAAEGELFPKDKAITEIAAPEGDAAVTQKVQESVDTATNLKEGEVSDDK